MERDGRSYILLSRKRETETWPNSTIPQDYPLVLLSLSFTLVPQIKEPRKGLDTYWLTEGTDFQYQRESFRKGYTGKERPLVKVRS